MKPNIIEQEILLNTSSTFFRKEHEAGTLRNCDFFTDIEQPGEVCWNILLEKWFPEIVEKSSSGDPLHLWQIWPGESFLQIHLCEYPLFDGDEFSIDSYTFLATVFYN